MLLNTLRLHSFRAHAETQAAFAPKVNLLYGPNGAGKTNLLEALHYLCLSKSFIASKDGYVLRKGCPHFEVEGVFTGDRRSELRVRLAYVPGEGKRIFVNGAPLERMADIVGVLPVVVFSPEDQALTAGGPEERRRFLDNIMSQAQSLYLDDLLKYRRALRQRNTLLTQGRRRGTVDASVLASWNEELVTLGSRVIAARLEFLQAFNTFLNKAYQQIAAVAEEPTIEYAGIAPLQPASDAAAIADVYRQRLDRVARRERQLGRTLIGPHRDELVFRLHDFEVRRYASQGQHRTFGMALKLAKYFYLHDRLEEKPLLLLDDVFDTLDARRTQAFVELLQTEAIGQSFITAAQRTLFQDLIPFETPVNKAIEVVGGTIQVTDAPEL